MIQKVLNDAVRKQTKEAAVRIWLLKLKDFCYDAKDVLDKFEAWALWRWARSTEHLTLKKKKEVLLLPLLLELNEELEKMKDKYRIFVGGCHGTLLSIQHRHSLLPICALLLFAVLFELEVKAFDLILPWLTPQELAAVSLTSTGLRRASLSVARRRSSDAAQGLEPLPVPFLNAVDSRPYAYFLYAPSSFSRALSPPNDALLPLRQPWGSSSRTASRPTAFPSREAADVVVGGVVLGCSCERCEGRD
ncbi:hypothetical protein NL676_014288 [Syzygium grande]|nr:hypothetical protein NL676_014288 [Syzygium grande]